MATSEKSPSHSIEEVKVEPVKKVEENGGVSPENTESDMKVAIKISRQFMILLEDYRYLMSCFEEFCDCHVKFDYQVFSKKLDEKYNFLTSLSSNNSFLLNALEDNSDNNALNELWNEIQKDDKRKESNDDEQGQYIKRIKLTTSYQPPSIKNDSDETDDIITGSGVTKYQNDCHQNSQFDQLNQEMLAYRCTHEKCDFITFTQEDVFKHVTNHEGIERKVDKNSVLYVCAQCSKEFSAQKWLNNHVENVHANEKVYTCDHFGCKFKTKFRNTFDEHKRRHAAIREFKCTWEGCTSAFVTRRDMNAHINFSHKNIKNYPCDWPNCTATFKDSNRLKHHYFTHTGERPYVCNIDGCPASFKQMPHLHKHRKTHAVDEDV